MTHIWSQFGCEEQADAVDFLHALGTYSGSTFFAGKFFHRSERGHTEEREQFPLNIIFPEGDNPMALDTLINQWADEGNGQFLYGSPNGVVLNLQRSALQEGTWAKHHRELDFNTHVNLLFSDDGHNVHQASYQIIGLVLHQGATHENGHYQAILAIDNVYWLADDNSFPTPMPHLTAQQRKEISVAAPTDELVTDTAMEISHTQPKKARTSQETLHFSFSNVTCFGKKVQDWVWGQGDTIMMFQETHLQQKALDTTLQYFISRGWKAHVLAQLLQFLDHLQAPFIIGGDWQSAPEDLAATAICSKFGAQILATSGPTTLQGSHLDFILASTSISGALRLEANWEVPWPHCALDLLLDCAQAALPVLQLQRFPTISRNYHPKHLWT